MTGEPEELSDNFNMRSLVYTGIVYKSEHDDMCQVALVGAGGAVAPNLESVTGSVNEALETFFGDDVDYMMSVEEPPSHDEVMSDPEYVDELAVGYVTSVVSTDGQNISVESEYYDFA